MAKVLIATVKPFSAQAVEEVKSVFNDAGYEVDVLAKYSDQSDLIAAVADAEALIIRSDKVDQEVIEAAGMLKIVVRAGAGYDNVDLAAATKKGVVVMNTPGQNSNAVAELALGMMVFMNRTGFTPNYYRMGYYSIFFKLHAIKNWTFDDAGSSKSQLIARSHIFGFKDFFNIINACLF